MNLRNVVVKTHSVSSLVGRVGTVLSQCEDHARVLFQFGEAPDNQAIADIALTDLHPARGKLIKRWAPPPEAEAAPTVAPIVVSEAHGWDTEANRETAPEIPNIGRETDLLRIRNIPVRNAALNRKLRIHERGIGPSKALRERDAEYERLQRMEMRELDELGSRRELDRWQKQRLTTYKNRFDPTQQ